MITNAQIARVQVIPAVQEVLNELYCAGRNDENNSERDQSAVMTNAEMAELEARVVRIIAEATEKVLHG